MSAVGTSDAGKPAVQIAAVKIAVDDTLHKWAEESVLTAEALIIDVLERFKVVFNTLIVLRCVRAARPIVT